MIRASPPDEASSFEMMVEVFVEIPKGSRNKYEYDAATGTFRLDRVLYSSVHFPGDYGFIPETLAEDGDPLDALVLVEEPTFPGCILPARPIGALLMRDERGTDWKILAVPIGDPRFKGIDDLCHIPEHWQREIENFFAIYKTLEGKETKIQDWEGVGAATKIIQEAKEAWREKKGQA